MPTQEFNLATHFWQSRLDDGTILSANAQGLHCLQPFNGPNGFVVLAKTGWDNTGIARKSTTGVEYRNEEGGAWQTWAHDGRYVIGAKRIHHGKQFHSRDAIAYIFDTQLEKWLNFVELGRPLMDIFRGVGSGQKSPALWVHNGKQVNGFEGNDIGGVIVRRMTFLSPTVLDYVLVEQPESNHPSNSFYRMQRTFILATGEMSAPTIIDHVPTNMNSLPTWLYGI